MVNRLRRLQVFHGEGGGASPIINDVETKERAAVTTKELVTAREALERLNDEEDYLRRQHNLKDEELRAEVHQRIRNEKAAINSWFRSGEFFILARSGRVHLPTCETVSHWLDRDTMWEPYLLDLERVKDWHGSDNYPVFPTLLDRASVEARRSYTTCQTCSPALDHTVKRGGRRGWQNVLAGHLGPKHFGLHMSTPDGRDIGQLVRVASVLTAKGRNFLAEFTGPEPITDPDVVLMYEKKKPSDLPDGAES